MVGCGPQTETKTNRQKSKNRDGGTAGQGRTNSYRNMIPEEDGSKGLMGEGLQEVAWPLQRGPIPSFPPLAPAPPHAWALLQMGGQGPT